MQFEEPEWLWLLAVVPPLLALLMLRTSRLRRSLLGRFTASKLTGQLVASYSPGRQRIKDVCAVLLFILLLFALARPQWGVEWKETRGRGIDILFAVDASNSMLADDVAPSRLARAKLAILDLVNQLEGDRIGLIAYSGNAFLQCPLTLDYDAFRQSLDVVEPGLLARGGTNVAAAIQEASSTYEDDENFKFLILITDGEDLADEGIAQARKAGDAGIRIFTVGVGSPEGARIPVRTARGRMDFLRDNQGDIVRTRLDENTLRQVADVSGGFYVPLGPTGEGLREVYRAGLSAVPRQELDSRLERTPVERFQIFLAIAVVVFVLESLLGNRRSARGMRAQSAASFSTPGSAAAITALVGVAALFAAPSADAAANERGLSYFSEEKYEDAVSAFRENLDKEPEAGVHAYNIGSGYFKQGSYDEAARYFRRALDTNDLAFQADVFYNLGNTHYRQGESALQSNPSDTIKLWERAVEDYENALELNPEDQAAAFNRDVVAKKLEQLQQQQQQQQQNQNQDQNQEQEQEQEQQNQDGQRQDRQNQQNQNRNQEQQNRQQQQQQQNQRQNPGDPSRQQQQQPSGRDPEDSLDRPPRQQAEEQHGNRKPLSEREIEAADGRDEQRPQPQREPSMRQLRMSPDEARQLLEALRQGERKLPIAGFGDEAEPEDSADYKDW